MQFRTQHDSPQEAATTASNSSLCDPSTMERRMSTTSSISSNQGLISHDSSNIMNMYNSVIDNHLNGQNPNLNHEAAIQTLAALNVQRQQLLLQQELLKNNSQRSLIENQQISIAPTPSSSNQEMMAPTYHQRDTVFQEPQQSQTMQSLSVYNNNGTTPLTSLSYHPASALNLHTINQDHSNVFQTTHTTQPSYENSSVDISNSTEIGATIGLDLLKRSSPIKTKKSKRVTVTFNICKILQVSKSRRKCVWKKFVYKIPPKQLTFLIKKHAMERMHGLRYRERSVCPGVIETSYELRSRIGTSRRVPVRFHWKKKVTPYEVAKVIVSNRDYHG
ncbi:predicted protein [Chaetoceros tenuissimus]|uniref:Uncharacterized protein n=1 Tax=Chaetoceros tenuissimus TaxID=426638 RepID=A0AAD3CVX2_9STRA|nr:predicted protein [Chaetoceros tenuissimus]